MKDPSQEIKVDVRIITATNRNLQERIRQGVFRDDLLYRLAAVKIQLPALRARPTDIPIIAKHLLDRINDQFQRTNRRYERKTLSEDAVFALCKRPWPGNVRELEAALKQVSVFLGVSEITAATIDRFAPDSSSQTATPNLLHRAPGEVIDLKQRMTEIEMMMVQDALREAGTQPKAGRLLSISQQKISKALKLAGPRANGGRKK